MHSIEGGHDVQPIVEFLAQRHQQGFAALGIDVPHFANMPREVAVGNEPGHSELSGCGAVPVQAVLRQHQRAQRPIRRHEEAEPQRRQRALRECSNVEDHVGRARAAQCLQRSAIVSELPIIVVLHDDGPLA
jgi:hypothetical protein